MKDEIKEILDKLSKEENYIQHSYCRLFNYEANTLLDYITNLQEKNNNLQEDFKRHIDRINELTERSDNLQEENERLNNIIEELDSKLCSTWQLYYDHSRLTSFKCEDMLYLIEQIRKDIEKLKEGK